MKKRKGVLLTLALAGAITLCGAGGQYVSMAKTMQEEAATQVWQEKESIYLPDGAKIALRNANGYGIEWDNCTIQYFQDDKYFEKETREDLGLAKLIPILKDTIKKYSGQEAEKCEMEVYLVSAEEVEE